MNLSLVLFLIGILGFVLNRKNIILMLISIEIMLLAVTLLVIISSFSFDDILGQTYSVYIIAIAGAESAIGLGILVAYYRLILVLGLPNSGLEPGRLLENTCSQDSGQLYDLGGSSLGKYYQQVSFNKETSETIPRRDVTS